MPEFPSSSRTLWLAALRRRIRHRGASSRLHRMDKVRAFTTGVADPGVGNAAHVDVHGCLHDAREARRSSRSSLASRACCTRLARRYKMLNAKGRASRGADEEDRPPQREPRRGDEGIRAPTGRDHPRSWGLLAASKAGTVPRSRPSRWGRRSSIILVAMIPGCGACCYRSLFPSSNVPFISRLWTHAE